MKWDPRSLADLIVLLERSNALAVDPELGAETARVGLWRTSHRPNEVFHTYGLAGREVRKYSLEDGRITEKPTQQQNNGAAAVPTTEIPQGLLRKYILYSRERCRPKLYQIDQDKIARLFADMRRESLATGAYPITVRYKRLHIDTKSDLLTHSSRSVTSNPSSVFRKLSPRCVSRNTVTHPTSTAPLPSPSTASSAARRFLARRLWLAHSPSTLSTGPARSRTVEPMLLAPMACPLRRRVLWCETIG